LPGRTTILVLPWIVVLTLRGKILPVLRSIFHAFWSLWRALSCVRVTMGILIAPSTFAFTVQPSATPFRAKRKSQ